MNADSYFEMGHSHKICEDYSLAGLSGDMGYAIVSDGCSSPISKHSDVGARILSHVAKDALLYLQKRGLIYDTDFLINSFVDLYQELIIRKCIEVKEALRFTADTFDATLLVAFAFSTKNEIVLTGWGDGYFITAGTEGGIDFFKIEYTSGAPYYLSYNLNSDKKRNYEAEYGQDPFEITLNSMVSDGMASIANGKETHSPIKRCSFFKTISKYGINHVAVSSDGLNTYASDPRKKAVDERVVITDRDIIQKIMAYKNTAGEFVNRRMLRIKSDMEKDEIIHQDDISCATITFI